MYRCAEIPQVKLSQFYLLIEFLNVKVKIRNLDENHYNWLKNIKLNFFYIFEIEGFLGGLFRTS